MMFNYIMGLSGLLFNTKVNSVHYLDSNTMNTFDHTSNAYNEYEHIHVLDEMIYFNKFMKKILPDYITYKCHDIEKQKIKYNIQFNGEIISSNNLFLIEKIHDFIKHNPNLRVHKFSGNGSLLNLVRHTEFGAMFELNGETFYLQNKCK